MSTPPERTHHEPAGTEAAEDFEVGSHVGEDRIAGEAPAHSAGETVRIELRGYLTGLALAVLLSAAAFLCVGTRVIYPPGIVMAVIVFGLAQVGVHLVFFLHLTTAPDNTNNVLALAFGFLIVCVIVFGTIWVMYQMDHNMLAAAQLLHSAG